VLSEHITPLWDWPEIERIDSTVELVCSGQRLSDICTILLPPSWFALVNRAFYIVSQMLSRMLSTVHASTSMCEHHFYALPSQNCTTAHFPLHAHFLAPESAPPPSVCRSSSSLPGGRPTTTSPLQVLSARDLIDDLTPSGPIAVLKGVVGSQAACKRFVSVHL
jgi:hypothetical protein